MSQNPPSPPPAGQLSRLLIVVLVLVSVLAVAVIVILRAVPIPPPAVTATLPTEGVTIIEPPISLQDFTLADQTNTPFNFSSLRGKYVLMFFGYTHCPDECPLTLAHYKLVKQQMGADAAKMAFMFISVDPLRDRPDVVAAYMNRFDASFIGLVGDPAVFNHIGTDYGLYESTDSTQAADGNYTVDHTTASYLVDPQGRLRAIYSYDTEPEVITASIRDIFRADGL
jgi:protein SCO1